MAGLNLGSLFNNVGTKLAEQLAVSLVEQRLVVPAADLQSVVDNANSKLQEDGSTDPPLTVEQLHAADLALIEYVADRLAKQL